MNNQERKRQLEIDICKLLNAYEKETNFSVTKIELVFVEGAKFWSHGLWHDGIHLVEVKVTAEV